MTSKQNPLIQVFRILFALLPVLLISTVTQASTKPNIVLIMADDIGYSDLGCFGGEIETPNLDSLATGGLRFTNFYSENMCWVSRAALMTGIYHKTSLYHSRLHPQCITLPEALKNNGYQTRMSGKWHLAGHGSSPDYPVDKGFEKYYGILSGAASFFAPHGLTRNRTNIEQEYQTEDFYLTHAISDNAIDFIKQAEKKKPLFLYVAYTAAHWPLHAFPEDIEHYRGRFSEGWDILRQKRLKKMKELGVIDPKVILSPRHSHVPAWKDEPNKKWQERRMEVYAAQITAMDRGIGQIKKTLKEQNRLDNTLIIFMIDNGGCHVEYEKTRKGNYLPEKTRAGEPVLPGNDPNIMPGPENTYQSYGYGWANLSNTPYRLFKRFDHEGGIHTPMIAHWPKKITNQGKIVKRVSHLIDIMPTVLEATNTKIPDQVNHNKRIPMDGHSLLSSLLGSKQKGHQELYFDHSAGKAVRYGKWKLVKAFDQQWELYDLQADPNELNDLSEKYPEKVTEMKKRFRNWSELQTKRSKIQTP